MGWQNDPVVGSGDWQSDPIVGPEKKRTIAEEGLRALGLAGRDVVSGVMSVPNMIVDGVNTAINFIPRGINAVAGTNLPTLGLPSQATQSLMTRAGMPVPETGPEHFTSSVNRAVTGFAPMVKGAQMAGEAVQGLPFVRSMLTRPVAETATVATGAAASEGAKQDGAPEWAQMAAGFAAPMAMSAGVGAAQRGATALNELRMPLTQGGAKQIAADVVGRVAQNKQDAIKNLSRYNTLVESGAEVGTPGFRPTAGAVSADYGLIGGQQLAARGDAAPLFAARHAANNEAVAADLGKLNATEAYVAKMIEKRNTITAPLRDAAFDNAKEPVNLLPVANKLGEIAGTAAGGRAESQKALGWIANRLEKYQESGRTDPRNAYALHQDIGDLIAGKINDNGSALRLAGGLANDVKKSLAMQIEQSAPGFANYMEHYSRLSKPIDRLEALTKRLGGEGLDRVTNAGVVATPDAASYVISQAKVKRAIDALNGETNLTERQSGILGRVLGNLNAETLASRGGKQPGADTYQNMAAANFMQRVLGDSLAGSGIAKLAKSPLGFAMRPLETRIQDIVINAYQDPKLMEELLRRARTSRASPSLEGLFNQGNAGLLGSVFTR